MPWYSCRWTMKIFVCIFSWSLLINMLLDTVSISSIMLPVTSLMWLWADRRFAAGVKVSRRFDEMLMAKYANN